MSVVIVSQALSKWDSVEMSPNGGERVWKLTTGKLSLKKSQIDGYLKLMEDGLAG